MQYNKTYVPEEVFTVFMTGAFVLAALILLALFLLSRTGDKRLSKRPAKKSLTSKPSKKARRK